MRKGVKKRIHRHMQELGCRNVEAYLLALDEDREVKEQCERLLTVSISRFFRDRGLWQTVDVRDTDEFKLGTFKTAINIPINNLEKKIDTLPKDKPIVFFCGSGGRSGEAYDMVKMFRSDLDVYFLDAELSFNKDCSYIMVPTQG